MDLVRFVKKKRHENIRNRFAKCGCYVEMRYEKNRDFRPISRFVSETIQDRDIFAMD